MSLTRYNAKRDFSRTREPQGSTAVGKADDPRRMLFVIQKHAATRLHFDLRLEMGGVLKSWAVPKGIPTLRGEKRLAMQVEDHPVEYASFEGIIPPGNYGAGTVMLWEAGIAEVLDDEPLRALRKGRLALQLDGRKLKGRWSLVRMRPGEERGENAWLLIKTEADATPIPAADRSVQSGRTMEQIAAAADLTWPSSQPDRNTRPGTRHARAGWRARPQRRRRT